MTYTEQMKSDILSYIEENGIIVTPENRDDVEQTLYDDLWAEDSVTGNGSGSYFFNAEKAREMVVQDGEQYIQYVIEEFCLDAETIAKHFMDWEYWDVSIRCLLLGGAIGDALDELEETYDEVH